MQSNNVLRPKIVAQKLGCSRSSLYNLLNARSPYYDASFPRPIKLTARSVGFLESEIDAWLASRAIA